MLGKCQKRWVTKSSRSIIICLYDVPAVRLGGHPSDSFSGHTGFLVFFCLFFLSSLFCLHGHDSWEPDKWLLLDS